MKSNQSARKESKHIKVAIKAMKKEKVKVAFYPSAFARGFEWAEDGAKTYKELAEAIEYFEGLLKK